ncbi:MAG: MBL fold metallo-hydrolase [Candidatus Woesebacteria bacterium]|nr:MAG: MBL fold metallo-hydrolase [Candidatus Woesebacteria bacterium]
MAKIKFLGASGTVTGSSFLVTANSGKTVLVDMGMFQGEEETTQLNFADLKFDPRNLSGVILTHAHLDHCGRLPLLTMNGFNGKIYMTEATRALFELTLLDAAKVGKEGHGSHPILYTEEDVRRLIYNAEIVDYHKSFSIFEFEINLIDAGHILGSASIEMNVDNTKIAFSGDLGNTPEDLLKPTENIANAAFVLMESTYGDRIHAKEDPKEVLAEEINEIEKSGGALLIPAFSIERSQEILHIIDHLKKNKKVQDSTPVYLDSPMAIKTTQIYKRFKDLYSTELKNHGTDDPFDFPGLTMIEDFHESEKIKDKTGAKVIIAGSGMMHGGRILNHAMTYFPIETTRLLLVGFQATGTLGRRILDGATKVRIYGEEVEIRSHVRKSSGMSAHADQPKLINWLSKIQGVSKVFLIHGEDESRNILSEKIKADLKLNDVVCPKLYDEISL